MTPTHTGTDMDYWPTGYSGQTNPLPKAEPCPFCGYGHILTWHLGHYDKPWLAECSKCSACGPHADTEREAIELWNKRVEE